MNFYQELGPLVLGTRLKRQSDYFLSEINKVYEQRNIPFEASWFGVFYLLDKHQSLSIFEIAEELEVSHSAISQLTKNLEEKGLVEVRLSKDDARKKIIGLSAYGNMMLQRIKPIWKAVSEAMHHVLADKQLMDALLALENKFEKTPLNQRIAECLNTEKTI